jgi:kinesin family protein 5
MRAKSIKNKAKINVEMSPAELKAELKRTVAALAASCEYAAKLELQLKGENGDLALPTSRPETRPETPMDRDERDEFLKRENELSDQLAEKESALATQEKLMADIKEELAYIKEQEAQAKIVSLIRS